MEDIKERVSELEKNVAVLQNENEHVFQALETLSGRINGMSDKKLTPMQKQLAEIHKSLHGSRGFMAGMFMTVGMVWAVIGTFVFVVYDWWKA